MDIFGVVVQCDSGAWWCRGFDTWEGAFHYADYATDYGGIRSINCVAWHEKQYCAGIA